MTCSLRARVQPGRAAATHAQLPASTLNADARLIKDGHVLCLAGTLNTGCAHDGLNTPARD
jgi:hypothetical protein